jgi:hypothetical protein
VGQYFRHNKAVLLTSASAQLDLESFEVSLVLYNLNEWLFNAYQNIFLKLFPIFVIQRNGKKLTMIKGMDVENEICGDCDLTT